MRLLHSFTKGVFIGAYASFWGALSISLASLFFFVISFHSDNINGSLYSLAEKEMTIGYVIGAFVFGLITPVIPLIFAGMSSSHVYNERAKLKSRIYAALIFFGAFLVSTFLFTYLISEENKRTIKNLFYYGTSYAAIFSLPYFISFILRLEKMVHIYDDDSNAGGEQ
jgi:MFS family permease